MDDIVDVRRGITYLNLDLGRHLYEMKTSGDYHAYNSTWRDFLAQPEIGLFPAEAAKLINLYQKYAGLEVHGIPLKVLNYMMDFDLTPEMLAAAETLSYQDFKERFHDLKAEQKQEPVKRTYEYVLMKKCRETGTLAKIHDVDDNKIKTWISQN